MKGLCNESQDLSSMILDSWVFEKENTNSKSFLKNINISVLLKKEQ